MNHPNTIQRKKIFTQYEADKSISFVNRIMSDIVRKWKHVLTMDNQNLNTNLSTMKKKHADMKFLHEAENIIHEIQFHISELRKMGCFLKDLNHGTVLYPAMQEAEEGYYAWSMGDHRVREFEKAKISYA